MSYIMGKTWPTGHKSSCNRKYFSDDFSSTLTTTLQLQKKISSQFQIPDQKQNLAKNNAGYAENVNLVHPSFLQCHPFLMFLIFPNRRKQIQSLP